MQNNFIENKLCEQSSFIALLKESLGYVDISDQNDPSATSLSSDILDVFPVLMHFLESTSYKFSDEEKNYIGHSIYSLSGLKSSIEALNNFFTHIHFSVKEDLTEAGRFYNVTISTDGEEAILDYYNFESTLSALMEDLLYYNETEIALTDIYFNLHILQKNNILKTRRIINTKYLSLTPQYCVYKDINLQNTLVGINHDR